jgi:hypothetical protein
MVADFRAMSPLVGKADMPWWLQKRKRRRSTCSGTISNIWNLYAKSSRQIDLVILFLH